jgi:hypothetical protein
VVLGEETTSIALHFGADDVNGTLEDERIQHMAGARTPAGLAREQLFRMIRDAGKVPVERDALYDVIISEALPGPSAPARPALEPDVSRARGYPSAADAGARLEAIRAKALAARRLSREDGRWLLAEAPLLEVGALANAARFSRIPERQVTFVVDSNPNYTNVCVTDCQFCAFYRRPGDPQAYTLTTDEVLAKVESAAAQGATTVLLQGGHNPALPLDYYLTLVRETRRRFPQVAPHFFSASEIQTIATQTGLGVGGVMDQQSQVGLSLEDGVRNLVEGDLDDGWIAHVEPEQEGGGGVTAGDRHDVILEGAARERLARHEDRAISPAHRSARVHHPVAVGHHAVCRRRHRSHLQLRRPGPPVQ